MIAIPRLPPPVRPGDRVGVAALSGPVRPERLERGMAWLAAAGFEPVPAVNLDMRSGLFAGSDAERVEAFHRLAADPTLKAIFFARGGAGSLRVLPALDWDLLARHPRAYVGYSDLTPFLLEVVRRLGLVAFHGPMVAADLAREFGAAEAESLLAALAGEPLPLALPFWAREGEAEGPVLGGCLSLLTACLGTPYAPDLDGAILFWEDVNEPIYRLDRMLTQLKLSGRLEKLAGMIVGHVGWIAAEEPGERAWALLEETAFESFTLPLAWGLECGHGQPNFTLPLGLGARLDPHGNHLHWTSSF